MRDKDRRFFPDLTQRPERPELPVNAARTPNQQIQEFLDARSRGELPPPPADPDEGDVHGDGLDDDEETHEEPVTASRGTGAMLFGVSAEELAGMQARAAARQEENARRLAIRANWNQT